MDKLRVPDPSNGFPFNWEDIEFAMGLGVYTKGIIQAIEGILAAYGDNFIVSGCEVSGDDLSEGWVLLDGELLKVDAHTSTDDYFEKVVTYNANGNKQTQTGGTEGSYQQNRATATAGSGNLGNPAFGQNPDYFPKVKILDLLQTDSDFYASESDQGVITIADQSTARAGANNTEAMTALRVLDALRNGTAHRATTTLYGVVVRATQAEVDTGTDTAKYLTPDTLAGKDGGIIRKSINIGDWNMDADASANISLASNGLVLSKILGISSVVIINDASTSKAPLDFDTGTGAAGNWSISTTQIQLTRLTGGTFDNTNYDSTSFNRGYIIVDSLP